MRCANASELYKAMCADVYGNGASRRSNSPVQPQDTYEAPPGAQYVLTHPQWNLADNCATDLRWALANTLHFFARTERAAPLLKYNKHASRFLDKSNNWIGAYGAIAMPQVEECITVLCNDEQSRRAVVSMGGPTPSDMNRPACWSFLHFLLNRKRTLDLLCYQRSASLKVIPYDLIVLTNLMQYVSRQTVLPIGSLIWTFGSLHVPTNMDCLPTAQERPRHSSLFIPTYDALCCWNLIDDPHKCNPSIYRDTLIGREA